MPGPALDTSLLDWPPDDNPDFDPDDEDASWEMLSGSRTYMDLTGFDHEDLAAALDIEQRWFASQPSDSWDADRDDLLYDAFAEEVAPAIAALDVGVASVVIALSSAGCVPATSCNGRPGHQYATPTVVFWTRRADLPPVTAAAHATGCTLSNGANGTAVLTAPLVDDLREFAAVMHSRS